MSSSQFSSREIEIRNTLRLAIATAFGLAVAKIFAVWSTGSISLLSSTVDSLFDMGMSAINLFAAREAAKPPDHDHAYGHGKIESLAGFFQSIVIGFSGFYLVAESFKRWIGAVPLGDLDSGMMVMAISIVINGLLVLRIRSIAQKHSSLILKTESLHFAMDFLTMGSILMVLFVVKKTGQFFWDPLLALFITGYIFYSAFRIFRSSIGELLDRSLPAESIEKIEQLIRQDFPKISGWHHFRSRKSGEKIFLDFHIEIRDENNFKKAHELTENLILAIQKLYPHADITIHYDPEGEV